MNARTSKGKAEALHVAVGRIVLRREASRMRFYWYTICAWIQAKRAPGNVYVATFGADAVSYWSISVWRSHDAMQAYRDSGSHARAMQGASELAQQVDFRHWRSRTVPTRAEAISGFLRRYNA